MMLEPQKSKTELLKDKIDAGLLNIYHAKERGYAHTDFKTLLREFLSSDDIKYYTSSVRKYLTVFKDLNKAVGHVNIKTIEINNVAEIYKVRQSVVYFDLEHSKTVTEHEHPYVEEQKSYFPKIKSIDEINEINIPIIKLDYYLNEADLNNTHTLDLKLFSDLITSMFKTYGFESEDKNYTFEKYIKGIEHANSEHSTDNNAFEELKLPNISNRLALMKELGVIDFLLKKYENQLLNRPKNVSSLLYLIMNLDLPTKKEKDSFGANVKNLLNNNEKSPYNSKKGADAIRKELIKIGIDVKP